MNAIQKDLFRRSLTELYHFSDTKNILVIETLTEKIYLKKILPLYHEEVFRYLLTHSHPNLPRVYDYYKENEELVVIEEYVSGMNVREAIAVGTLTEERKREIVLKTADALMFLHGANPPIIHRDVKAENILLTEDGGVKLIDYDAARTWVKGLTRDTVLMGTAGSAAPEQYGFGQSDERTDIYGLGCLMRELGMQDLRMRGIIARATALDPAKRFQSVSALRKEVEGKRFSFFPIPGFRSREPWKMLLAVFGYALLMWLTATLKVEEAQGMAEIIVNRLCFFMAGIMTVDCAAGWTPLFERLPYRHSSRRGVRLAVIALTSFLLFVLWACAAAIITAVMGGV